MFKCLIFVYYAIRAIIYGIIHKIYRAEKLTALYSVRIETRNAKEDFRTKFQHTAPNKDDIKFRHCCDLKLVDSHLNYCRLNYGTFELLLV